MARCRSCRAPIEWVATESGKHMPVEEREGGNLVLDRDLLGENPVARVVADGEGTHVSHFATCPDGDRWRGRKP